MKRVLLFCVGVLLALVSEVLLWWGPGVYAYESTWVEPRSSNIIGLGIIAWGVGAALGAAVALARAFARLRPEAAQHGTIRPKRAPASVLAICAILFFLGPLSAFFQAYTWRQRFHDAPTGQAALVFGILYLAGGVVVARIVLNSRREAPGRRLGGLGCGIAIFGLLVIAFGVFVSCVNGMMMEGRQDSIDVFSSFVVLAGILLTVMGSIVAVVGGSSNKTPSHR